VESFLSSRIPLHQAVAQSLKALGSVEAQSRMATSILLTGGGAHGLQRHDATTSAAAGVGKAVAPANYVGSLADAFEERLIATVPYACPGVNTVHCLRPSGASDAASSYAFEGPLTQSNPQELAWRGAAILARAETTRDMWLSAEEWKRCGPKILREKLPFAW
jgi:actin-related protein